MNSTILISRSTGRFGGTLLPILVGCIVAALSVTPTLSTAQNPQPSAKHAKTPQPIASAKSGTPQSAGKRATDQKSNPLVTQQGRAALKPEAHYGVASRNEASDERERAAEDPSAAAREAYENRAYPAPYVPFEATRNARQAWSRMLGLAKSKDGPAAWTLAGPSAAQFPGILTFAGTPYT